MNKFIGSLIVLFVMSVISGEARILIGTNGNVVVDDLGLRMPTPQEVKAYENPGTVVPVYPTWATFEKDGFWHCREISRTTNAVVFRDGRMHELIGEYAQKIKGGFMWQIPIGILSMVMMVFAGLISWRGWGLEDKMSASGLSTVAFILAFLATVSSLIHGVSVGSFITLVIATVCSLLTAATSGIFSRVFFVLFHIAMTTAILWGLW